MSKDFQRPSYHYIDNKIVEWGRNFIYNKVDDPCIDNFRMARIWKSSDRKRYRREYNWGCCGYYDTIVEAPDKNIYLIGCNYGH